MEFCEPYREQYHNELCWGYPISDGKHLGTFLVLVREGVLSLPYDDADKVDYELFCLEDARMCDFESIEIFLSDWKKFAEDLEHSMLCMREYAVCGGTHTIGNCQENELLRGACLQPAFSGD